MGKSSEFQIENSNFRTRLVIEEVLDEANRFLSYDEEYTESYINNVLPSENALEYLRKIEGASEFYETFQFIFYNCINNAGLDEDSYEFELIDSCIDYVAYKIDIESEEPLSFTTLRKMIDPIAIKLIYIGHSDQLNNIDNEEFYHNLDEKLLDLLDAYNNICIDDTYELDDLPEVEKVSEESFDIMIEKCNEYDESEYFKKFILGIKSLQNWEM